MRELHMRNAQTRGSVRGDCGHHHRTVAAAEACLEQDRRGCASQGGYSDREVYAVTGDVWDVVDPDWEWQD